MISQDQILESVKAAISEVNSGRPPEKQVQLVREALLYGPELVLDSISLVWLIVGIEQRLEEQHGIKITIADDKAFAGASNPFRSVGSLVDYIARRLGETTNG